MALKYEDEEGVEVFNKAMRVLHAAALAYAAAKGTNYGSKQRNRQVRNFRHRQLIKAVERYHVAAICASCWSMPAGRKKSRATR